MGALRAGVLVADDSDVFLIVISADGEGLRDVARAAGAAATLHKRDFVPSTLDALWLRHMPDGR